LAHVLDRGEQDGSGPVSGTGVEEAAQAWEDLEEHQAEEERHDQPECADRQQYTPAPVRRSRHVDDLWLVIVADQRPLFAGRLQRTLRLSRHDDLTFCLPRWR